MEDQLEVKVVKLRDSIGELEEMRRLNDQNSSGKLDLEKVGSILLVNCKAKIYSFPACSE